MSERPPATRAPIDEELWRVGYPAEAAREVDVDALPSLVDMLTDPTAPYAERSADVSLGARMSFAELDRASRDFAADLRGPLRAGAIGLPLPSTAVQVRDPDGRALGGEALPRALRAETSA